MIWLCLGVFVSAEIIFAVEWVLLGFPLFFNLRACLHFLSAVPVMLPAAVGLLTQLCHANVTWTVNTRVVQCYCAYVGTLLVQEMTSKRHYLLSTWDSQDVMLCTLASSQRLIQDICEMTNYVVRTNLWLRMTSEWTFSCMTTTTWHTCASQLARVIPSTQHVAGGSSSVDYCHLPLDFFFQHMASRFSGCLPSSVVIFCFLSTILWLPPRIYRPATGQSHVTFCLLLRFYVLVLLPRQ